ESLTPGFNCTSFIGGSVIGPWLEVAEDPSPQNVCNLTTDTIRRVSGVDLTPIKVDGNFCPDIPATASSVAVKCANAIAGGAFNFSVACPQLLTNSLYRCSIWNPGAITVNLAMALGRFAASSVCNRPKTWKTSQSVCGAGGIMDKAQQELQANLDALTQLEASTNAELSTLQAAIKTAENEAASALTKTQSAASVLEICRFQNNISSKEMKELINSCR
ncbi:MAG: hypothetical protein WCL28_14135, partial [bacterium]